jgi:DNA-binding MarR family transcriptional regulator
MSSPERTEALERISDAGRSLSDAAVLFHGSLAERMDLAGSHWKTLGLLERFGPQTAGDLSRRSGLAPASISGILDKLEAKDLVIRGDDPDDRRRTRVELNPAGVAQMYGLFEGMMRRLAELHDGYTTEELLLIAGYMARAAELQREATRELADTGNP